MVDDSDALRKPWIVNEDGILVDPGQLRAVGKKLIAIFDVVWRSGLAHQVFGNNIYDAANTVVGIHQLIDQSERERAGMAGQLVSIHFAEQEVPEQELYEFLVVFGAANLN